MVPTVNVVNRAFCPCCLEFFDAEQTIPKILLCGHSICVECAPRLVVDGIIRCAICRRPTDLPGNDVGELNNNFSLIDALTVSADEQYECHHCSARTSDPDSVQLCRECCGSAGLTVDLNEADFSKLSKNLVCCRCFLAHHSCVGENHTRIGFLNYILIQQYKEMADFLPDEQEFKNLASRMNGVIKHLDNMRQTLLASYKKKKPLQSLDTLSDLKTMLKNNSESYAGIFNRLQITTIEVSAEIENLNLKLLKSMESSGEQSFCLDPPTHASEKVPAVKYPKNWLQNAIKLWSNIMRLARICIWLLSIKIFIKVASFFITDPSSLFTLLTVAIVLLYFVILR